MFTLPYSMYEPSISECLTREINAHISATTVQPIPYTETENGQPVHSSTGNEVLDYFIMAIRGVEEYKIMSLFVKAYQANPRQTLAVLMHLRDVRDGKGERDAARYCLLWLRQHHYVVYLKNLETMLDLGYFKDLLQLVKALVQKGIKVDKTNIELRLMASYITADYRRFVDQTDDGQHKAVLSLAAKWAPSLKSHFDRKENGHQAQLLSKIMYPDSITPQKDYRLTLSKLREELRVVERLMSQNRWDKIDFDAVPATAHHLLRAAFSKHQVDRYKSYIDGIKICTEKVNVTGTQPNVLVKNYINYFDAKRDPLIEAQWQTMIHELLSTGIFNKSLAVVDVSDSMYG